MRRETRMKRIDLSLTMTVMASIAACAMMVYTAVDADLPWCMVFLGETLLGGVAASECIVRKDKESRAEAPE